MLTQTPTNVAQMILVLDFFNNFEISLNQFARKRHALDTEDGKDKVRKLGEAHAQKWVIK